MGGLERVTWAPTFCSEDTDGEGILITTTTAPGNLIHTATSATGAIDQINLYASNNHSDRVLVSVQWGARTLSMVLDAYQPFLLVVPGGRIKGGKVIRVYASIANVVVVNAVLNRFTP
jgi:hypothetical protein